MAFLWDVIFAGAKLRQIEAHVGRVCPEADPEPGSVQTLHHRPVSLRHSTVQRHVRPEGLRRQNIRRDLQRRRQVRQPVSITRWRQQQPFQQACFNTINETTGELFVQYNYWKQFPN